MALRLKGSSSGYAEIDASADAGSVTLTLPATAGTINVKDGSGTTNVGTGVNLGNPEPNVFTISTNGSERLRIAADGAVSIGGTLTYEDVTSVDAVGLSTFRDGLITKDVGIATITSSDINGATAVDVFVYDTSKDSDGGAWRKRTSHTSWYNEDAAAGVRGSRKEFPAVAVIVAEAAKVTIYDGDDPDLPLWMAFNLLGAVGGNSNMLPRGGSGSESDITSIACLNGRLVVGLKDVSGTVGEGLIVIDFISELARVHRTEGSGYTGSIYNLPISGRNSNGVYSGDYNVLAIVAETINDVAMTVLPNAPVDSATGLPVPTIAVGTNSGVSVIKDDGTVVNKSTSNAGSYVSTVDFTSDYNIAVTRNNYNYIVIQPIEGTPSSSNISGWSNNLNYFRNNGANYPGPLGIFGVQSYGFSNKVISTKDSDIVSADSDGLNIFNVTRGINSNDNMVAYITSNYNTGYLHGNIKGAFLSDTSTTNRDADTENLITGQKHDYETDTSESWSSQASATATYNASNGVGGGGCIALTSSGGSNVWNSIGFAGLTANKDYAFRFSAKNTGVVGSTTSVSITSNLYNQDTQLLLGSASTNYTSTVQNSYENKVFLFNSGSFTTVYFNFYSNNGTGGTNYLDEFYITEVEKDRSINGKGLSVFGTITKTAVATGAELVSYSGWSASNNLVQPYNSDLNFGTGDFIFIAWIKKATLSTNHYVLDRNDGSGETDRFSFMINAAGKLNLYSGSTNAQAESASIFAGSSAWRMVMVKRVGGAITFGLDGKEYTSTTTVGNWSTTNLTGSGNENLFIGQYGGGGAPGNVTYNVDYGIGEIANVRLSASAPSPEQFKKMYEDEKHLYQENVKCTLHGSSDAVTALAYDEVTDQLHVGTSSGRSDFQGLRRINNTTDPVTTAISAHDTFIIEQ